MNPLASSAEVWAMQNCSKAEWFAKNVSPIFRTIKWNKKRQVAAPFNGLLAICVLAYRSFPVSKQSKTTRSIWAISYGIKISGEWSRSPDFFCNAKWLFTGVVSGFVVGVDVLGVLVATRSRSRSDSRLGCHSTLSRRFATRKKWKICIKFCQRTYAILRVCNTDFLCIPGRPGGRPLQPHKIHVRFTPVNSRLSFFSSK